MLVRNLKVQEDYLPSRFSMSSRVSLASVNPRIMLVRALLKALENPKLGWQHLCKAVRRGASDRLPLANA